MAFYYEGTLTFQLLHELDEEVKPFMMLSIMSPDTGLNCREDIVRNEDVECAHGLIGRGVQDVMLNPSDEDED